MALLTRKRDALTASAAVVGSRDSEAIRRIAHAQRRWQHDAWQFYDSLPEIHYPANFVGASMSRFIFVPGEVPSDNPSAEPVVVSRKKTDIYRASEEILFQLSGEVGGTSELGRRYGVNMIVAAEGWLTGQDSGGSTNWDFLSIKEIAPREDGKMYRNAYGYGMEPEEFSPQFLRRFWKAHPGRTQVADSALNPLAEDCKRLLALNESITSRLISRLSQAGVLFIPNTIQVAGEDSAPNGTMAPSADPFFNRLINTMTRAIQDRSGAAGAIPIVVRGASGEGEHMVHLTLDRKIDEVEMTLRAELRRNIATGMDLPPELQTSMEHLNHWSSWSVMDSSFRTHLKPMADSWADGLTRTYLWPALRSEKTWDEHDIRRIVVVADGSSVVSRPNEAEDGRQLFDRNQINGASLRRRTGVGEDEQPDDDELVRQMGMQSHNPFLATWGLKIHDKLPWDKIGYGSNVGAPGAGATPTDRRPADSSDPAGAPGQGTAGNAGGNTAEQPANPDKPDGPTR